MGWFSELLRGRAPRVRINVKVPAELKAAGQRELNRAKPRLNLIVHQTTEGILRAIPDGRWTEEEVEYELSRLLQKGIQELNLPPFVALAASLALSGVNLRDVGDDVQDLRSAILRERARLERQIEGMRL